MEPDARPGPAWTAVHLGQALERLYAANGYQPLWTGPHIQRAHQALELLRQATADGLNPADYGVRALGQALQPGASVASTDFEIRLSHAMLSYLAELHFGRIKPGHPLPQDLALRPKFDPAAQLFNAWSNQDLAVAAERARPDIALYRRIKASLARYRQLAALPLPPLPPLTPLSARDRLGQGVADSPEQDMSALTARLQLFGDLEGPTALSDPSRSGPALADALRRFQHRHGLAEDGKLGPATWAALSVPLAHRVRQLELSLERLRWLPRLAPGRLVAVNLPAYRLWALDTSASNAAAPLEMRVIVGKAGRTATPVFVSQLRHLEFNPYWNVPSSIALGEIAPRLARDPGYLARQGMELVSARGQVVTLNAGAAPAALRAGTVRLRQRPGRRNVLGAVKFAMPNSMNIYLHSTAATELFGRVRRDLSHGCIRVEQPAALASFVLEGEPGWDKSRVDQAMLPGPARVVHLGRPVPVVLFYATAVTGRDHRVLFADDVYRHDLALIRQLEQRSLMLGEKRARAGTQAPPG